MVENNPNRADEQPPMIDIQTNPNIGLGFAPYADRFMQERRRQVLPPLGKDGAPTLFEGTEFEDVTEWIKEFDGQCDAYNIDPPSRCKLLAKYVSMHVKEALKGMPEYISDDWAGLKEEFITSFRSTTLSMLYTLDDLRALAHNQATILMTRPSDFEGYLRRFRSIAQHLTNLGTLTTTEKNRIFWSGFTEATRERLENVMYRLQPENPSFKDNRIPFGFELQLKAARQMFSVSSFDARDRFKISESEIMNKRKEASVFLDAQERIRTGGKQVIPAMIQNGINLKAPTPINQIWGNQVPGTVAMPQRNDQIDRQLGFVIDKLSKLSVGSLQYSTCYQEAVNEGYPIQGKVPEPLWARPEDGVRKDQPRFQNRDDGGRKPTYPGACFYCGLYGHKSTTCELVREHVKKGWISISTGRVTYPNGTMITGPYGKKKSLIVADHWNSLNTNFFEVADDEQDLDLGVFEVDNGEFEVQREGTRESYDSSPFSNENVHRINTITGEYEEEEADRFAAAVAMAIQTYEKGRPGKPTSFAPGPKGKPNAVRDKFTAFREKPNPAPTSGSNRIPVPEERYKILKREPPAREVDHRIKEDRAREAVIPPEDIEMKEVVRDQRKTKKDVPEPPPPQQRTVRQSDFAREVDPFKVVNTILNAKVPMNLSIKELLAVSPLTSTLVNKGTRVHQQQPNDGMAKNVTFAETHDDIDDVPQGNYCDCRRCSADNPANYSTSTVCTEEHNYGPDDDSPNDLLTDPLYERTMFAARGMNTVTPVTVNERVAYHRKLIKFNGEIEGNKVKFMIDTGSEIDVCPQHVYATFENKIPVRSDLNVYLKGMNGPTKRMRGVMENCEIKIGNMRIHSNVHLHDEGPDCIILGQPFLHRARFEHYWENDRPSVRFTTPEGTIEFPYLGVPYQSTGGTRSASAPPEVFRPENNEMRTEECLMDRCSIYNEQDFYRGTGK